MACFHPITAFRGPKAGGGSQVVFDKNKSYRDLPSFKIPCGQCVGCRLERSRQWAIRCMHEAQLYEHNSFVTLTYSDEFLPFAGSLCLRDFQLFMKRLRFKFGAGIRFYHCGEYGEQTSRPHYHAILFNLEFPDKKFLCERNGFPVWTSDILSELWGNGLTEIGTVTFESAAYVARYIMKKVTGEMAEDHYSRLDVDTGEIHSIAPEYTTMSRRPGIGSEWLSRFKNDVYPSDEVIVNGHPVRPPKFYDTIYERSDPDQYSKLKRSRILRSRDFVDNNTPERLSVREKVQLSKLSRLPRNLE